MTVCVAVIARQDRIICVSDRMLTVFGMEFEPATSKMFYMGGACGCMYAGDGGFATEVISRATGALEKDGGAQRSPKRAVEHFENAYEGQ